MSNVARKGNMFLKALAESDYDIKAADTMMEIIKSHVSKQLAEDMLYDLLSQSHEDTPYVTLKDCGPRFINCIKLVRQYTGFGLKDAKDLCDYVRDVHSVPQKVTFSSQYNRTEVLDAFRREGCEVE